MVVMIKALTSRIASRRMAPDGFIVVAVLWILGALSVLVSIYAVYVVNTASAFTAYDNHIKAQALADFRHELSIGVLTDQHPDVAMRAMVRGNQHVLMPKCVDVPSTGA